MTDDNNYHGRPAVVDGVLYTVCARADDESEIIWLTRPDLDTPAAMPAENVEILPVTAHTLLTQATDDGDIAEAAQRDSAARWIDDEEFARYFDEDSPEKISDEELRIALFDLDPVIATRLNDELLRRTRDVFDELTDEMKLHAVIYAKNRRWIAHYDTD